MRKFIVSILGVIIYTFVPINVASQNDSIKSVVIKYMI